MIYEAINEAVLHRLPASARRVLDVGCGTGALGARIKALQGGHIVGITYSTEEAVLAREHLDEVLVRDLNALPPLEGAPFEAIVCSHVLEHLVDPEALLRRLRAHLTSGGKLIVALPNVLHWRQRLEFLRGRFRYTEGGLMDRTHLRFYDVNTARALVEGAGYHVLEARADGCFPASRFLGIVGQGLNRLALRSAPGLFGTQFLLVGTVPLDASA